MGTSIATALENNSNRYRNKRSWPLAEMVSSTTSPESITTLKWNSIPEATTSSLSRLTSTAVSHCNTQETFRVTLTTARKWRTQRNVALLLLMVGPCLCHAVKWGHRCWAWSRTGQAGLALPAKLKPQPCRHKQENKSSHTRTHTHFKSKFLQQSVL